MNNHMSLKLVGANSSLEINSPITSIYLQEELTGLTTLPGIRETKGMNIGMDGGWTSAQFYEPRLITIKGVIANQDVAVVEQRRKQLIQLLAEKRLALEFQTEAGNHYTMNVVVAGVQMPLSKVLTASYFQLSLRADDPLIYDNNALAELEAILRRSSSASSGFTINFPINFQLGTSESRPTIDNFGSSVIYPTITLTGPLTTPEIVNITTNMAFTIDEVLGAGTYTASGIRGAMAQEGSVDTYSGNPIQAARDAESPISKFSLYGKAEQTTYSGKNLMPLEPYRFGYYYGEAVGNQINYDVTTSASLVTFTPRADGTSTMAVSASWRGTYFMSQALTAGTYYLNLNGATTTGNLGASVYVMDSDHKITRQILNTTASPITNQLQMAITLAEGETYISVGIGVRTTSGTITLGTLMLSAGSTATAYEPYVGGTPAPNPEFPQPISVVTGENVVKIEGKNLLQIPDSTNTSAGVTFTASNGTLTASGTTTRGSYAENDSIIPTLTTYGNYPNYANITEANSIELPAGTYTASVEITKTGETSAGMAFCTGATMGARVTGVTKLEVLVNDATGTYTKTATFTIAEGERLYVSTYYEGNSTKKNVGFAISNIQLELGSTATTYEPYQGQEFEVNLGKNLFDGIIEQGGFDGTGLNVGAGNRVRSTNYIPVQPNTKYTIKGFSWDTTKGAVLGASISYYSVNDYTTARLSYQNWVSIGVEQGFTFTTPANCHYIRFLLTVGATAGGTTAVVPADIGEIQVEKGSQATSFAPFLVTKNLFNKNTATQDYRLGSTGEPFADSDYYLSDFISVTPDTAYYISGTSGTPASSAVCFYDSTQTFISRRAFVADWYSFTTPENTAFLRFTTLKTNSIDRVQLELGSTATFYEPYGAPYELCKIGNYQDRIYKENGKWYIEKQIAKELIDNLGGAVLEVNGIRFQGVEHPTPYQPYPDIYCEFFKKASNYNEAVNAQYLYPNRLALNANGVVICNIGDATTVQDYRDFFGSNQVYVYYPLATPTTTEITNEALIAQLDAILEAHLYEGLNNISNVTISPNLAGDLEIKTGQTLTVINSLSIVGSSGTAEIGLGGAELAMVGSVADELTINGTTGAVTKTARIGKIASYAGETITTDYISTSGGLDSDATIYYVLPSSSTSVINTLDSTALAAFNGVVASGGVSAQTNIGSISVDITTVTAQDVAVVDTKQHTVTINGVGAYSKFLGDWLTLDVGLNELQLITENNTDTGSAVIKYRVGYMGV